MNRHLAGVAAVLTLLFVPPLRADVETWRPKPIFTAGTCSAELSAARPAMTEKLKEAGVAQPDPKSKDAEAIRAYGRFLSQLDAETASRAKRQAATAGRWRGQTRYATVKWQHRHYRITSCQIAKIKIPLARALRIVSNVATPSKVDGDLAEKIKSLIAIKKARKACRKIRPFKNARTCLKRYSAFEWLDRYPMN